MDEPKAPVETKVEKPKTNIIFTGRLTLERLKELAATHGLLGASNESIKEIVKEVFIESQDNLWNPAKNPNVISIVRQSDGNYIGAAQKNGQVVTVRDGIPDHVLTQLLTHA